MQTSWGTFARDFARTTLRGRNPAQRSTREIVVARVEAPGIHSLRDVIKGRIARELNKPVDQLTEADVQQVRKLGLDFAEIEDDDLKYLESLASLQSFNLGATQITDAGITKLRKALPKTRIFSS